MYYYVEDKQFLRRAQRDCSSMLTELVEELRKNGVNSQFFLVGSGGREIWLLKMRMDHLILTII